MKNSLGRCTRTEYWTRAIFISVISFSLSYIQEITEENWIVILMGFISLLLFIYIIIWGVKRMHDVNKSGWYILVPIYNFILAVTPGTKGPNDYGEDPKTSKVEEMEEQDSIGQTTENSEIKKRPTAITVICVLGFIGAAIAIPMVFSQTASQIGSWYPPYLGLSAVLGTVCMVGLWQMKKWAAYTYTGFVVLNQIVLLAMGVWNIMALILPAIVIGIALSHVNKMD